jgi:hypothetical protein
MAAMVQKTRVKTGAERWTGPATDSRTRLRIEGGGASGSRDRGSAVAASRYSLTSARSDSDPFSSSLKRARSSPSSAFSA